MAFIKLVAVNIMDNINDGHFQAELSFSLDILNTKKTLKFTIPPNTTTSDSMKLRLLHRSNMSILHTLDADQRRIICQQLSEVVQILVQYRTIISENDLLNLVEMEIK